MINDVQFNVDNVVDPQQLLELFGQTDWADKRTKKGVETMLVSTAFCVTATYRDKLIGFARVFTDWQYRAFVEDVIVDADFQKQGIGKKLVEVVLHQLDNVEEIALGCSEHNIAFYQKFGFETVTQPVMKRSGNRTTQ